MATTTGFHTRNTFSSSKSDRSLGALLHLSTLTKYFIPFGNFIFPLIIWVIRKQDSQFIDHHGRQGINFQISLFLYSVFIVLAGLVTLIIFAVVNSTDFIFTEDYMETVLLTNAPFLFTVITLTFLLLALVIIDLVCVITATSRAAEGKSYKYPLSISFLPQARSAKEDASDFREAHTNENT